FQLKTTIAHLSTVEGMHLCLAAKENGIDIKTEICFHHLLLNSEDNNDNYFQVNPPLRKKKTQKAIFDLLSSFDYLVTDHAPHTYEEKITKDPLSVSGLPGLDTYGLMIAYLIKEMKVDPTLLCRLSSYNPSKIFNYFYNLQQRHTKNSETNENLFLGDIKENYHGKFAILDFSKQTIINKSFIKSKCKHSPYEGMTINAQVTLL
ncbi:MAG: hypothetical protein HQK51_10735, partial [Oligoflexia bacterium]|nr:hypothetical protein [Oligoflexia bacterium]